MFKIEILFFIEKKGVTKFRNQFHRKIGGKILKKVNLKSNLKKIVQIKNIKFNLEVS